MDPWRSGCRINRSNRGILACSRAHDVYSLPVKPAVLPPFLVARRRNSIGPGPAHIMCHLCTSPVISIIPSLCRFMPSVSRIGPCAECLGVLSKPRRLVCTGGVGTNSRHSTASSPPVYHTSPALPFPPMLVDATGPGAWRGAAAAGRCCLRPGWPHCKQQLGHAAGQCARSSRDPGHSSWSNSPQVSM